MISSIRPALTDSSKKQSAQGDRQEMHHERRIIGYNIHSFPYLLVYLLLIDTKPPQLVILHVIFLSSTTKLYILWLYSYIIILL